MTKAHAGDYEKHEHTHFIAASAVAMADPQLQTALARLGEALGQRNRDAYALFKGSDATRDRARAIKDQALADLPELLTTLEASVQRRGGHVHYASDAAEARQIILGLLQQCDAKKIVKSKSMTTEEVHLNPALEDAGYEVVETDLGEYLIQLAKHRPSHLVAPAVHMRLKQITEILSADAGEELPPDPPVLTAFARRRLRDHFATADVGLTGGNFVVAETGTVVLISNEGNARLTTSLPRVMISLVGVEKIIPKLADLPVFLKVLARAATGQKLSIYTSMITGTKQPGELDGPEEFHLVLLDNGRTKILEGPLRESLFCIRCGACLNACPIYRNVGGHAYGGVYAGPIGAVITPLFEGLTPHAHLPQASSLCGACQAACPVKIAIPEMLIKLRDRLHKQPETAGPLESLAYGFWARCMRSANLYGVGTWFASRLFGRIWGKSGWISRLPLKLHGWTKTRDFPAPARERFRDWWDREGKTPPPANAN